MSLPTRSLRALVTRPAAAPAQRRALHASRPAMGAHAESGAHDEATEEGESARLPAARAGGDRAADAVGEGAKGRGRAETATLDRDGEARRPASSGGARALSSAPSRASGCARGHRVLSDPRQAKGGMMAGMHRPLRRSIAACCARQTRSSRSARGMALAQLSPQLQRLQNDAGTGGGQLPDRCAASVRVGDSVGNGSGKRGPLHAASRLWACAQEGGAGRGKRGACVGLCEDDLQCDLKAWLCMCSSGLASRPRHSSLSGALLPRPSR
jgi:hypothetical protein